MFRISPRTSISSASSGGSAGTSPEPSPPNSPTYVSKFDAIRKKSGDRQQHFKFQDDEHRQKTPYLEGNLKFVHTIELSNDIMCCLYSPDGSVLAVGLSDGIIKVLSTDTGKVHYSLSDDDIFSTSLPCTAIRFKPAAVGDTKVEHTHILVATYSSGLVKFWHYTSGSCIHTINEAHQTLALGFNPEHTKFITAAADSTINLYDEHTKQKIRVCEASDSKSVMDGHRLRVFAVQYHPHNTNQFVSGGWDDTVQFWDDRQRHAIRRLYGPHICGDALDIDAKHDHLLTGSWRKENTLQIWDYGSGKKIKDVPQDLFHTSLLYCAHWLGKEFMVCGGCEQNMVRVIDRGTLNTTGQLIDLPQGAYTIDNDRIGMHPKLAIGSARTIYILKHDQKINKS
ncbi:unnamed protein product [Owenia fusiformis]|uniref:Uncharacterized protein n=1 Tax=Owenia fusiformis TaxID=6347 RepID=A0A8J1UWG2_OWEFU|nr:unnamed protein product [Owenia fusiformis]